MGHSSISLGNIHSKAVAQIGVQPENILKPQKQQKNAVLEILIHVQLFFWGLYYDGWNLSTSKQWMVYTETNVGLCILEHVWDQKSND